MRKIIELTPEWVLEKIPHSHYSDGNGNSSVYTGNATDANWIELALEFSTSNMKHMIVPMVIMKYYSVLTSESEILKVSVPPYI
jgi:hypothetical protein